MTDSSPLKHLCKLNNLSREHCNTVAIWKPNTWIPASFEYQTVWVGVWYSNGCHMTWHTIWIPDILDRLFSGWFSLFRPPFEYWTIWQPDTNLPFDYPTSPVFRWLLYYHLEMKRSLPLQKLQQKRRSNRRWTVLNGVERRRRRYELRLWTPFWGLWRWNRRREVELRIFAAGNLRNFAEIFRFRSNFQNLFETIVYFVVWKFVSSAGFSSCQIFENQLILGKNLTFAKKTFRESKNPQVCIYFNFWEYKSRPKLFKKLIYQLFWKPVRDGGYKNVHKNLSLSVEF